MRVPQCANCGSLVVELEGQFTVLDSYYLEDDGPPPETAGWWHARCLAESDVGPAWYTARLRNFRDIRGYQPLVEFSGWTILQDPNRGKRLAFGRSGELL